MAKTSTVKKPVLAWGWQSEKGDLVADAFATKVEASESIYSTTSSSI